MHSHGKNPLSFHVDIVESAQQEITVLSNFDEFEPGKKGAL